MILNLKPGSVLGPAVKVERWYDRANRVWIITKLDANGYQIGDAATAGTKADAVLFERDFKAEINAAREKA